MNGAHIVMGVNDPAGLDPKDPLVFGAPYLNGPVIGEYVIAPFASAFRHWSTPHTPAGLADGAEIVVSPCHTSISFTTKTIAGWPLTMGTDGPTEVLWALHTDTYLKGYHGYMNRGKMSIDWKNFSQPAASTGTGTNTDAGTGGHGSHRHEGAGNTTGTGGTSHTDDASHSTTPSCASLMYATEEQAVACASAHGKTGAHAMGDMWMVGRTHTDGQGTGNAGGANSSSVTTSAGATTAASSTTTGPASDSSASPTTATATAVIASAVITAMAF